MRMNEIVSGIRSDVAVKLFGDDLDVLAKKGREIEAVLRTIRGSADVATEQITGQPVLEIKVDQQQLARYGLPAKAVLDLVESIGSKPLGEVVEGQLRFPAGGSLAGRVSRRSQQIASMLIATPSGERLPLSRLASVELVARPGDDHPRMGPAPHQHHGQRPRPRHGQLRGRSPAQSGRAALHCRRAATRSNGAGSSRISSEPARGC